MSNIARAIQGLSEEQRLLLQQKLATRVGSDGAARPRIAVIGMSCRFPGAASPEAFWQLLLDRRDAITEVPADRWDVDDLFDTDVVAPGKMATRWGGFLSDIDQFDADFFGISPREAERMDPQQRLLLETTWEALERAGRPPRTLAGGRVGVFVGIHSMSSDYYWRQAGDLRAIDAYTSTGGAHSIVANRLSYLLDLRGPSMAVDTACSSSLVVVHLACQSLRAGECDTAIVAGVNLMVTPEASIAFSKLRMMAADGRCKTFDASADGFVRGEGCGVVILRRLESAQQDAEPVLALIRGSAVNQDGATNGLTAPSGLAQRDVVRQALRDAEVSPARVTYVETHGTGTALGDPIEVEALAEVLGDPDAAAPRCVLGAVKTNIGHLESAAGVAGLIKAVLCLQHRFIPANLHFRSLNPHIRLAGSRFVLPGDGMPWLPDSRESRVAAVSSFGFGGTNAHVVLEEHAVPAHADPLETTGAETWVALPLSGRSPDALHATVERWRDWLQTTEARALTPADIAYTAGARRDHHEVRRVVIGRSAAEWSAALDRIAGESREQTSVRTIVRQWPGLAFVYSGQGPQRAGMGLELYAANPVFRAAIDRCAEAFRKHANWSLLEELARPRDVSRVQTTEIAQPAIFAVQYGLTEVWRDWGVTPDAVVGHSVGEIAAAWAAGALRFEDAALLVLHRGRIMQQAAGHGAMVAVELSAADARDVLGERASLDVAAVNSPGSCVLSGCPADVARALQVFRDGGVPATSLGVDCAFHSIQMQPLQQQLVQALSQLAPAPPKIPMASTVTGRMVQGVEHGATYWARNLREPVLFCEAIKTLATAGHRVFLELGPHPVLTSRIALSGDLSATGTLRKGEPEPRAMLDAVAALYQQGAPIRFARVQRAGRTVPIPTYPWQRTSLWFTPRAAPRSSGVSGTGERDRDDVYDVVWRLQGRLDDSAVRSSPDFLRPNHAIARRLAVLTAVVAERSDATRSSAPENGAGTLLRAAVAAALENLPSGRALRMLEIGAGTGATTAVLLPVVPRDRTEYIWTDESAGAVQQAAAAFADEACVRAVVLDPERPIDEQGFTAGQVDVIVLGHAARGTSAAFVRIRQLLAPCGLLLIGGGVGDEGATLKAAGFESVTEIPIVDASARGRDGRILLASAPRAEGLAAASRPTHTRRGTWCIFADRSGVGDHLRVVLSAQSHRVVVVQPDGHVDGLEHPRFNVTQPEDAARLVASLLADPSAPLQACVHLSALDAHATDATSAGDWNATHERVCGSAIQFTSALKRSGASVERGLWYVTRGAQAVGKQRDLSVAQAPLWGAGRVMALEAADLWGGLVDLDPCGRAQEDVEAILQEVLGHDSEDQVALRGRDRYVPRLVPVRCADGRSVTFRQDRAYLITGGTGRLGLQLAEWMSAAGAGWIVLASRRGAFAPDASEAAGEVLQQGTRNGAVIEAVACDISDREALRVLLDTFGVDRPPLAGIIHAAAVLETQPLTELSNEALLRVLQPKVTGAWNLHVLTARLDLECFVLMSSAASVWGAAGMAHYAAGNHFLDALASYRRRQGLPSTCVNWGWWQGGGSTEEQHDYFTKVGVGALSSHEALSALGTILQEGASHRTVARVDWSRFQPVYEARRARPLLTELARRAAVGTDGPAPDAFETSLLARLTAATPSAALALLTAHVRDAVARTLAVSSETLDEMRGFFDLGMDSIMSVELRGRLESSFQRKLPPTIALEYPTVRRLCVFLAGELGLRGAAGSPTVMRSDTTDDGETARELELDGRSLEDLSAMLDRAIIDASAEAPEQELL